MNNEVFDEEKIEGHLVKVKYSFDRISERERRAIIESTIGVVIILISAISLFTNPRTMNNSMILLALGSFLFVISIPTITIEQYERSRQKRIHKEAVKKGIKVIATIIDSINVKMPGAKRDDRYFKYSIEYEDENNEEAISVQTPPAITENMYITEQDLPLKAVVYIYKQKGYIDAVINPPIMKMATRRFIKNAPLTTIITSFVLCAAFYGFGLIIISSLFFIIGIFLLIIYIFIWRNLRK